VQGIEADFGLYFGQALGKVAAGVDALIALAQHAPDKHLIAAQISAIRALGKYPPDGKIAAALIHNVTAPVPRHPRTGKTREETHDLEAAFSLHLGIEGASINALAELRAPEAAKPLVLAMYRTPELYMQIRRALVAIGPAAESEVLAALTGQNKAVNELFAKEHLDRYCGDHGDQPCQPVSAKEFYPAVVIGDFHDAAAVPALLAILKQVPVPQYYVDDQPSAITQHHAVLDALRKIGSPDAAAPLRALWSGPKVDATLAPLAAGAYPFVTRDATGIEELGKIAADNTADDDFRQEAATAYARLASSDAAIKLMQDLAQRYLDASAKKHKDAAKLEKAAKAAETAYQGEKKKLDAIKAHTLAVAHDSSTSAATIKTATEAARQAEDDFKDARRKYKEATAPYKQLEEAMKAYRGYARMFQTHIARIEIAMRCKQDAGCYAASVKDTPDAAAAHIAKHVPDLAQWTDDEKADLVGAEVDRAMLELGKMGPAASGQTSTVLAGLDSDQRLVRQAILLALPKFARVPCPECMQKLEGMIERGQHRPEANDLGFEAAVVYNYLRWKK
jgi:hypothetical protein